MKRFFAILSAAAILLTLASCGSRTAASVGEIIADGKRVTLQSGDSISVSVWFEPEYYFNDEQLKEAPVLCGGITIGSSVDEMIAAFGIKPGYAAIDREIDTAGDGTTEIVTEPYENTDFFTAEKVLDANIRFAFAPTEDGWTLIPAEELKEVGDGEGDDGVIQYAVDFVGGQLAADAPVEERQIIAFAVTRF